ncbi:MAG TPA: hypothetical protein VNF47_11855 [Streptosporangiaceae bacterium]|nr:hypothetical protein [Streptosporangiaceae bacterium]
MNPEPAASGPMTWPAIVAHADWGTDRRKRQVAVARRLGAGPEYRVTSLGPAPDAGLFLALRDLAAPGQALAGFDFPIGLPRRYAEVAGINSFTGFLDRIGSPPWHEFDVVARQANEITLRRPFYPAVPGGTRREHQYLALGLTAGDLRRRCEGTDAETLFWTLGSKQAGKGALAGWRLIIAARDKVPGLALWPFDGTLPELLDGSSRVVVAETYPREYYRYLRPAHASAARWSKRRQADRLTWIPGMLRWAESLGVGWEARIAGRVRQGFSAGANGEDEFDAVTGLLGMIGVLSGTIPAGEPGDDPCVATTEGWILGRRP